MVLGLKKCLTMARPRLTRSMGIFFFYPAAASPPPPLRFPLFALSPCAPLSLEPLQLKITIFTIQLITNLLAILRMAEVGLVEYFIMGEAVE
jgi:hypothetical protein